MKLKYFRTTQIYLQIIVKIVILKTIFYQTNRVKLIKLTEKLFRYPTRIFSEDAEERLLYDKQQYLGKLYK